jgi:F-type H+-transporting ATPase subunit b
MEKMLSAGSDKPIVVSSSHALARDRRQQIKDVLDETFSSDAPIRFETDNNLVSGIAVTWGSYRIAWNMNDYLVSLEKSLEQLVNILDSPDDAR